jgi:hypothetical protein
MNDGGSFKLLSHGWKTSKKRVGGKIPERRESLFFFFYFFFFGGGFLIIQGSAWIIAFVHITGINFWKPPNYCEPDLPWKD